VWCRRGGATALGVPAEDAVSELGVVREPPVCARCGELDELLHHKPPWWRSWRRGGAWGVSEQELDDRRDGV
jgi:hypothetical protein